MWGDTHLSLVLPPTTEEWVEELVGSMDSVVSVRRDDEGVHVGALIGGNCNAVTNARGFLADLEDALREGDIDPYQVSLTARKAPK